MATSTTNLGLTKPAGTDKIRIAQINGNMDILDEKIGAVGNTSLQAQVTSQNEAIANINTPSLISVSDFNSLTTPGRYSLGGNYTNAPKQNLYGYVDVVNYGSNTIAQTVYSFASTGSTIYERRITGNTWGSWEELALNSDTLSISTGNVTAIASGSNLNNYTTPGTYSVANYSTATGITNIPVVQAGRLIVAYGAGGSDYIRQIYIPYGSNDICTRYYTGSWSSWGKLATGEDISSQITPVTGASIQYARKFGNRILIKGTSTKITTANTFQSVATIASGYRPSSQIPGTVVCAASADFGYGQCACYSSGNLEVAYSKATTYGLVFSIDYLI